MADLAERVAAVRRFNRFYTKQIGVLREGLHDSAFSLTEARVLYELAHRDGLTAGQLAKELALDAGYLSRILRAFARRGLLDKTVSEADGRQSLLALTKAGRAAFAPLNEGSRVEIGAMLAPLADARQRRLVAAMDTIEGLLSGRDGAAVPYLLRPHQPGDIGWVAHRQAVLYAEAYGFDERFEALVAEIGARFINRFDPKRERCWIAERDGEIVGSVFLVKQSARTAKLRLLYVEPSARGLGIGRRLVDECIRFARLKGYRKITLWTNDILVSARRIYQAAGFTLVAEERHHSFGHDLVGQNWELAL
ncbi:MAG: bifunctional helix-turn-helix transcriptional regulator/GNAT family N-acetyltransferase [Proteobacteria bacterium]|nr:bifunctional helix-turn-helix transcriptional regulator/GNAT family N-acetyltransferase [Pseudomonadota bacterium]